MNLAKWTNEEISTEMAAWVAGGDGARLAPHRAHMVVVEYERRCGTKYDAAAEKAHLLQFMA
ncbi:hypothetical protein D3C80_677670 [compost metagenome]